MALEKGVCRVAGTVMVEDANQDTPYAYSPHALARAIRTALAAAVPRVPALRRRRGWSFSVRLVGEAEARDFNARFRGKDYVPNVLSFPLDDGDYLGDLVVCVPVLAREAQAQHKTMAAHAQHLVVHGLLHLLGYDHLAPAEADVMEALEIRILRDVGLHNPYIMPDGEQS